MYPLFTGSPPQGEGERRMLVSPQISYCKLLVWGMRLSHRYVVAMATQCYLDVHCSGLFEALLCLVILFSVYVQPTLGHVVEGGGATLGVCQLMGQCHLCKLCVCVCVVCVCCMCVFLIIMHN